MGVSDYYDPKTNKPLKGWEKNIMAKHGRVVEERNINEILTFPGLTSTKKVKEVSGRCKK